RRPAGRRRLPAAVPVHRHDRPRGHRAGAAAAPPVPCRRRAGRGAAAAPRVRATARSAGLRTMPAMAPDELDDPGANTAMFRAYVEEGQAPPVRTSPPTDRGVVVAYID